MINFGLILNKKSLFWFDFSVFGIALD